MFPLKQDNEIDRRLPLPRLKTSRGKQQPLTGRFPDLPGASSQAFGFCRRPFRVAQSREEGATSSTDCFFFPPVNAVSIL